MSESNVPIPPRPAPAPEARESDGMPLLMKGAIWVAIGSLIAAAIVTVVWVLLTPEGDIIGKAFLTILLLAGFAGVTLLDANLASKRPQWFVLASTVGWVIVLLSSLTILWSDWGPWGEIGKAFSFISVIVLVVLALVHQRLFWKSHLRYVTTFTRTIALVTTALVVLLLGMALLRLVLPYVIDFPDIYGRLMVSVAILGAVGTAMIPLLNALFGPKKSRPQPPAYAKQVPVPQPAGVEQAPVEQLPWPMYADGVTPFPMLPNGQPDFEGAHSGVLSPGARHLTPATEPAAPEALEAPAERVAPAPAPPQSPFPPTPPRPE
ncbi:hypothetical protein [Microbacterium amylolyticum]|uniref:Uncharacterized protein n=1 Tax=Microbacterium amylolyticum TaxID=936337 RepID=A0ABS4ZKZ8_9MICO|nr:hypothetical protein [Microbacterium amylolyticum]MBP2437116.1 hypothetical protein [Microbacterium amylolyticum]